MPALNTARQNAILLAVLLVLQLLLMSSSVQQVPTRPGLESWTMRLSSPVVRLAQLVGGGFRGVLGSAREMLMARARSAVLESDLQRLNTEIDRYREAERENLRLRELLEMREVLVPKSIVGRVVTSSLEPENRMLVLDRGSQDGVRNEQSVVAWGGAIGRVVAVGANVCKVRLLSDPNSGVAGIVQRSRAEGNVDGNADGTLDLRYVPRFSDIVHGDRVVTSGLEGIFPRGFGIGHVTSIREEPDGTQKIKLQPELDYSGLEEVLIVIESIDGAQLEPPAREDGA